MQSSISAPQVLHQHALASMLSLQLNCCRGLQVWEQLLGSSPAILASAHLPRASLHRHTLGHSRSAKHTLPVELESLHGPPAVMQQASDAAEAPGAAGLGLTLVIEHRSRLGSQQCSSPEHARQTSSLTDGSPKLSQRSGSASDEAAQGLGHLTEPAEPGPSQLRDQHGQYQSCDRPGSEGLMEADRAADSGVEAGHEGAQQHGGLGLAAAEQGQASDQPGGQREAADHDEAGGGAAAALWASQPAPMQVHTRFGAHLDVTAYIRSQSQGSMLLSPLTV